MPWCASFAANGKEATAKHAEPTMNRREMRCSVGSRGSAPGLDGTARRA
jgi:hypothetical protein